MTIKKAETSKKAAPIKAATKKAAPARRAMPAGAKVEPVKTLGKLITDELQSRGIQTAATIEIKRITGEAVRVNSFTDGIGMEPASGFDPNTLKITQDGKAGC